MLSFNHADFGFYDYFGGPFKFLVASKIFNSRLEMEAIRHQDLMKYLLLSGCIPSPFFVPEECKWGGVRAL